MKNHYLCCLPCLAVTLSLLTGCSSSPEGVVLSPAKGAKDVNPDTHLTLTFKSVPTLGGEGMIRVYDAETGEPVDSLDMSIPAGPTEPRTYGADCDYAKVSYDYSRTSVPTNRDTRPGTPSGTAEPTLPDYQLNIIGGFTDAFHFHPIIVHDSVATIYLHNNMLDYGKKYRVTIDPGVLTLADGSFRGVTAADDWCFTTKTNAPVLSDTITVSADGNADFNTVQGALDFIPDFSEKPVVITVAPGDYEEIVYARNKSNVTIQGAGMDATKVHYANNEVFNPHPMNVKTNEWPGTFPSRRAAFMLDNCSDIVIKDMTIATDLRGQAEGLLLMGDRIALYRVHIIGSGDALQANGTVYMQDCEMDGGGDTILGRGSLFAYRSNFRNGGGPFSWVRNTKGNHGDVFVECSFSTEDGKMADYGRTGSNHSLAYPDAEFVLIDCKVKNIIPEGWSAIGEPTQVMLEYNTRDLTTDEPVDVSRRHRYSRQLTLEKDSDLISSYRTPAYVLKGWTPSVDE
ncbi:MAG: pectinesterase family protein [Bacteroides sp.]|nr:pectinesterase family protein [Bacteroides sp.]